jgi:hypothetical protein
MISHQLLLDDGAEGEFGEFGTPIDWTDPLPIGACTQSPKPLLLQVAGFAIDKKLELLARKRVVGWTGSDCGPDPMSQSSLNPPRLSPFDHQRVA